MHILVLNAGSSSQKSRLYKLPDPAKTQSITSGKMPGGAEVPVMGPHTGTPAPLWSADADWNGSESSATMTITAQGRTTKQELPAAGHAEILPRMLQTPWQG